MSDVLLFTAGFTVGVGLFIGLGLHYDVEILLRSILGRPATKTPRALIKVQNQKRL